MAAIVSTQLFRFQRLGAAQLDLLQGAGAAGVELFCGRMSFDYHNRSQAEELGNWFAENPLKLHSVHSPIYADERDGRTGEMPLNIADTDPRQRVSALDEVERVIEFSERASFPLLIQHLGPPRAEWNERMADHALSSLERIRLLAKQAGITVLVENIPNGLGEPQRLVPFLEASHLEDVGVCFDTGHAHLAEHLFGGGGVGPSWEALSTRVRSTHIHDNHGTQDEHLWPGEGTIAWAEWLRQAPASVPLVLEVTDLPGNHDLDLKRKLRDCFRKLEQWRSG